MTRLCDLKKSGLVAAFFYLLMARAAWAGQPLPPMLETLAQRAIAQRLHESPAWLALLHVDRGTPAVRDARFLLSLPDFSPARELRQTLAFLYGDEAMPVCRFPARYQYLRDRLSVPPLPLETCPEVREFRARAPAETLSLVFASENLAQPASIMGHAFLKLEGRAADGRTLRHAVSFYTDTGTGNLPKLLLESMVTGKPGYFALAPFDEKIRQYLEDEQRNVWVYPLHLPEAQRQWMLLHLLELKQTRLNYLFQGYNCATVMHFILAIGSDRIGAPDRWVTPRDLVKEAAHAGLIDTAEILSADRWLVRSLAEQMPSGAPFAVRDQVLRGFDHDAAFDPAGGAESFLRLELANTYNNFAYREGLFDGGRWEKNHQSITALRKRHFPDAVLEIDGRKNPQSTPPDSQATIAAVVDRGQPFLRFMFLPASHFLADDNRGYGSESELLLFETSIKAAPGRAPQLERLTLYGIHNLMPRDPLTGGFSGRFRFGIEPHFDAQLASHQAAYVSGALGLTQRLGRDVDVFSLLGGGVARTGDAAYAYATFEAGALIREIWQMKSLVSFSRVAGQIDTGAKRNTLRIAQSKYLDRTQTLEFEFIQTTAGAASRSSVALGYKRLF